VRQSAAGAYRRPARRGGPNRLGGDRILHYTSHPSPSYRLFAISPSACRFAGLLSIVPFCFAASWGLLVFAHRACCVVRACRACCVVRPAVGGAAQTDWGATAVCTRDGHRHPRAASSPLALPLASSRGFSLLGLSALLSRGACSHSIIVLAVSCGLVGLAVSCAPP
jgi:hypothetical protein